MARVRRKEAGAAITRDEIHELRRDAKRLNVDEKDHVRRRLEIKYPGLADQTVRRNGHEYNALDYLMDDLDAYGPVA